MFNSYVKLPEGIVHDYHYSFIAEPLLPVPDDAVVQRHLGRQGLFQRHNTPSPVAGCGNLWLFPFGNGIHGGVCESISLSLYTVYIYTVSARIIERSQEDKSTVKYRTFVLLRVPIRSGVGKFNYRTGRRTKVRYFTVLLSSWLRSIISGTDMIFTAYLYIYNL